MDGRRPINMYYKLTFVFYCCSVMQNIYADRWSDISRPCDIDMCVMKWRSSLPIFHSFMILAYILKTNIFDVWMAYFGIMSQCDVTFDLKINEGHGDLYFMVQRFCLISWRPFDVWTWMNIIPWIMSRCDMTFDLKINLDHSDQYFTVQWFSHIPWRLFYGWTSY